MLITLQKKPPLCTLSNRKGREKDIILMDGPACPSIAAQFSTLLLFQQEWEVRTDSLGSLADTMPQIQVEHSPKHPPTPHTRWVGTINTSQQPKLTYIIVIYILEYNHIMIVNCTFYATRQKSMPDLLPP